MEHAYNGWYIIWKQGAPLKEKQNEEVFLNL